MIHQWKLRSYHSQPKRLTFLDPVFLLNFTTLAKKLLCSWAKKQLTPELSVPGHTFREL